MSYRAIAAALALEDVSIGERLVAFSLASYANRAQLAWPAARTAAARAGLGRRQYLVARDRLADRGLIAIEQQPGGATVRLRFAEDSASIEREVNAELVEAVLERSSMRGGARSLLAALAALADRDGLVAGVSVEEICEASGLSDRTYRRARGEIVAAGEVVIEQAGGGRGCQNLWRIADRRAAGAGGASAGRARPAPGPRQLPLVAVVRDTAAADTHHDAVNGDDSDIRGVEGGANPGRNPGVNPGQNCTPPVPKTPAQTPAETPAPYARAGRESQNQRTAPPDPPEGGQPPTVQITERFTSARGRSRTRRVHADPSELAAITESDRQAWTVMRQRLREAVGESMFEIWLAGLAPIAVSRRDGALLLAAPAETHAWVMSRYGALFDALSPEVGRRVRPADGRELALHAARSATPFGASVDPTHSDDHDDRREAI